MYRNNLMLIFCLCVTVAFAKPDVSHLFNGNAAANHGHHHDHHGYQYEKPHHLLNGPVIGSQIPHTSYNEPASGIRFTTEQKPHNFGGNFATSGITYTQQEPVINHYPTTSYAHNFNNLYDQHIQYDDTPIVTKNFYFHSGPQDQTIDYGTKLVRIGRPQKSYKVIFIKTPSYHARSEIVPILPVNEEKTFVYVLNKQPTFDTKVTVQEQLPATQHKPDVFFLKYKTAEEANRAEEEIKNTFEAGHIPGDGDIGFNALKKTLGIANDNSINVVTSNAPNVHGSDLGLTNHGVLGDTQHIVQHESHQQQILTTNNHGQHGHQVHPTVNYVVSTTTTRTPSTPQDEYLPTSTISH